MRVLRVPLLLEIMICLENVNRSEKFPNVFGGHLIFMKIHPSTDEDSYVYYLGVVKNLPILKAL
jgi:hypothetical protein